MNLSAYEIALIAGGFTIIGTLLGAWITYRNALEIQKVSEHNKAVSDFKNAFLPEIIFIKHGQRAPECGTTGDLSEVLEFGYANRHLKAIEVFKAYLPTEDRMGIDKALERYCRYSDKPENIFFDQYFTSGKTQKEIDSIKELALERIEEILRFAKHK